MSRAQQVVVAAGAVAGAIVSIGTLVIIVAGWLGGGDDDGDGEKVRTAAGLPQVVESGTGDGDDFVRFLLANDGRDPVALDLTVRVADGSLIDPYLPLWYNCAPGAVVGSGACNLVRLEFPSDTPVLTTNPSGWRFRGTYRVMVRNGVDYGTDLDISFDDIST
jgi:hypothetical protein